jgi:hypothetical protein
MMLKLNIINQYFLKEYTIDRKRNNNNNINNNNNNNNVIDNYNNNININTFNFYLFYDIFISNDKDKKIKKEINSALDYMNNYNINKHNENLIQYNFLDNNNNNKIKIQFNYEFQNKFLLEETKKKLQKSNKGILIFLDKFFSKVKLKKNKNDNNKNFIISNKNFKLSNNNNNIINYNTFSSNKIFSRKFLIKNHEIFLLKTKKAKIIQTNFRRFISQKKNLTKIFNKKIIFICEKIFFIQSFWKKFVQKKALNKKILIENIKKSLNFSSNLITKIFKKFKMIKNFKKNLLISSIKNQRKLQAIKIQKKFRGFFVKKFVENYLIQEKNCFKITYPFKAYDVQIKFFIPITENEKNFNKKNLVEEKIFKFEFSKLENIFVLFLNEENIKPGKYRAILMIDKISFCDGRFPHVEFSDGNYYNIIDVKFPYINIKKNFMDKIKYNKDNYFNDNYNDNDINININIKNDNDNDNYSNINNENNKSICYSNNSTQGNFILRKNTNFTYDNDNDIYNLNTYSYNKDNNNNNEFLLSDSFYEIINKKENYNNINNKNFNWFKEYNSLQKNLRNNSFNRPICYMNKLKELIKEESLDLD